MARQPQHSKYSDLHTYCQAFTISGRVAMSAGQLSTGFLFWAQRPQIAGMTATQKNCAAGCSRSFLPKCRKALRIYSETPNQSARAFGERFWHKTRLEKRRNTLCISSFSSRRIGAKDPAKAADDWFGVSAKKMKGGNQMKTRKKWRPGGRQRQSAAYHRKAVHERKRVVRLRAWKKGERNGAALDV